MDLVRQKDEILALESIYDPADLSDMKNSDYQEGVIRVHLELPCDFHLTQKNEDGRIEEVQIENLPPLSLHFRLPGNYPSKEPPQFLLSCPWLNRSKLSRLCQGLDHLWEEHRFEILYTWIEYLKTETLPVLEIAQTLDITSLSQHNSATCFETFDKTYIKNSNCDISASDFFTSYNSTSLQKSYSHSVYPSNSHGAGPVDQRTFTDLTHGELLLPSLKAYDQKKKELNFLKQIHECKICLQGKSGHQSMVFKECSHIYCKECLKEYYKVLISDGHVQSLRCPTEKCSSLASPNQVKELVGPEYFQRYERLLLDKTLDTMKDIIYCPRTHCQYPVIADIKNNIARCSSCMFAFCTYCKRTYHGVEPCRIADTEALKLRELYLHGTALEKSGLEKKYGKKNIQKLVEDGLSEDWVKENSKSCPNCHCPIEKIDGCNKITCHRCCCNFCWICNKVINQLKPYLHFNDPQSACFNKLFEGVVEVEDAEDDDEFGMYL